MPPDPPNAIIAALFDELADLYELDGAVVHRVLAYRNAAKSVREAPQSVAALTREGRVTSLPGIGRTLEEKIQALMETGTIPAAEKLRAKFPVGLVDMTRLPGLGPKRARKLFDELGIDSLEALEAAAQSHQLRGVKGFGAEVRGERCSPPSPPGSPTSPPRGWSSAGRSRWATRSSRRSAPTTPRDRVELAGSARRMVDSVKDLDIVATASDPPALLAALGEIGLDRGGVGHREQPARARTHTGIALDLRVVEPDQFGNVMQHLTGSKNHNMALREMVVRRGLHVSEYGVLDDATGETHRCATEEEVYALLGLPWIPPELREDRGELRFKSAGDVPVLIEQADLRGDLHMHTVLSDGRNSTEEMALAARDLGLSYIAITDHSASHGFGNHVDPERAAPPDRAHPRARRAPRGDHGPHRDRDEHRHRRPARLRRRPPGRARLGDRLRPHLVRHRDRRDDRPHRRRHRASARRRDRPPDRAQDRARARRTRSTWTASSRRPRGPGR